MLFNLSDAWAQSAETRTAEGQMEIKPLQIGDTTTRGHYAIPHQDTVVIGAMRQNFDVDRFPLEKYHIEESLLHKLRIGDLLPEELLKLPLTVISRDGNTDTLCLKEFGDQLIVLDFWAGWCAPCVRSMEKWETYMDSLKGNYAFFGAHIDYACKALPFIEKKEWNSPSIIGMNGYVLARSFFDRIVAGKLVWIKNQRLLALTGVDGYDRRMVQDLIDGKIVQLPVDSTWTY